MRSNSRRLGLATLAALALAAMAGVASAHPLGNYTVNRAVRVELAADALTLRYVIDMAEIPAFSELQSIDRDGNGQTDADELATYATAACATVGGNLELEIDVSRLTLEPQREPQLSFPAGAGGLSTLRLVCAFSAEVPRTAGLQTLTVSDRTDDGHVGWREVTISVHRVWRSRPRTSRASARRRS